MRLMKDPQTGLMLPDNFIDEKQSLKRSIELLVNKAISDLNHVRENYFLTIHAKFDSNGNFCLDEPSATLKIPGFISNSFVYWISNQRGIKELLWMVPPTKKGEKLKVEFNKTGVAYLQAKGAMAS